MPTRLKRLNLAIFIIFLALLNSSCSVVQVQNKASFSSKNLISSYYFTSKNETLASIAKKKILNLSLLERANPRYCTNCKIATGAWILIPPNNLPKSGDVFYKTHKGDNLGKLAEHFQVSVASLLSVNKITLKDGLRIGQVLQIPIGARDVANYAFPVAQPQISHGTYFRNFTMRSGLIFPTKANENIYAIAEGKVIFADTLMRLGKVMIVEDSFKRQSVFAYCSQFLVKEGDLVKRGQLIAKTGFENKTGAYGLYFELRHNGKKLSPENYLPVVKYK